MGGPQLSLVIPVKDIGAAELARLTGMACAAGALEVVVVGKLSARHTGVPANLKLIDHDCRIYDAMNLGARSAQSRYTLFMGIDDALIESNVGRVIEELSAIQSDLVILPFRVETRLVAQSFTNSRLTAFHHQGVLFHRERLLEAGGYDQSYALHADLDLMFRMQRTGRIATIGLPLVRFSKGGMTTSGRHSYDSIRQFGAIYAAHRVSRLSFQFVFSVALLLLYRLRFVRDQIAGGWRIGRRA
jgi:hypothetical protein